MRLALRHAYEKAGKGKYIKSGEMSKYSRSYYYILNSCFTALELYEDMYTEGRNYAYLLNFEKLKYVWPDIESYPRNHHLEILKEKEKNTRNLSKRVREALIILGYKSLEELKKEHEKNPDRVIEKIKSLSAIDYKLHGFGKCNRQLPRIKKRLLNYLNTP